MAIETRIEQITLSDIKDRSSVEYNFVENGVPLSGFETVDGPPVCDIQSVSDLGITAEVTTFFEGRLCQTNFRIMKDLKALAHIVANLGQHACGPMKFITISAEDNTADYLEEKLLDGDGVELIKYLDSTGDHKESLTINVRTKNSIEIDSDQIQLDGDEASPGFNKYYGTDVLGNRGWIDYIERDQRLAVSPSDTDTDFLINKITDGDGLGYVINSDSSGSEDLEFSVQVKRSLEIESDYLQLLHDEDLPGSFRLYGTDVSGNKGWIHASRTLVSATDVIPDYLTDKLIDGDGLLKTISTDSAGSESIDFSVRTKNSITIDLDQLQLLNDVSVPGSYKHYGTDVSGNKGWVNSSLLRITSTDVVENYLDDKVINGNVTTTSVTTDSTGEEFLEIDVTIKNSIEVDSNALQLENDEAAPGNSKFYGTTTGGVKGWQDIPVDHSLVLVNDHIQLYQDQTDPGSSKYYGTDVFGSKGYHSLPVVFTGNLTSIASINTDVAEDSTGDHTYTTSLVNDELILDPYRYYGSTKGSSTKGYHDLSDLPSEVTLGGVMDDVGTISNFPVMRRCTINPTTGAISTVGTDGTGIVLSGDGVNADQQIIASKVWNAVWNDIADFQDLGGKLRYGKCYADTEEEAQVCSVRCQKGVIGVASDTFGYALGVGEGKVPIAISGWVLAYVDKEYERGTPLTNDKNGNLTEMLLEEKQNYPERMVAIYKKKETSVTWGKDEITVNVNGRHWVKVK